MHGRGHAWEGACVAGGMRGRGACMAGDVVGCVWWGEHGWGCAWQGACMVDGVGMHGRGHA